MLQNLANKPSYAKEAYMANLNPFVDSNKARINQFLNALCDVGDFYDTLEVRHCFALNYAGLRAVGATDGPIYGSLEERLTNQHHPERIV